MRERYRSGLGVTSPEQHNNRSDGTGSGVRCVTSTRHQPGSGGREVGREIKVRHVGGLGGEGEGGGGR